MKYLLPFVLAGALSAASGHRICGWIFDCGCTWMLTGGDTHCNVHAPRPPHCPVCSRMDVGAAYGLALFGGWFGVVLGGRALLHRNGPGAS